MKRKRIASGLLLPLLMLVLITSQLLADQAAHPLRQHHEK